MLKTKKYPIKTLGLAFMSFPLDRLLNNGPMTKHQKSAEVFIVISFQKEMRTAWPHLLKEKKQQLFIGS